MKTGQATGLQIAFLMFAVMLISVPASHFIIDAWSLTGAGASLVEKGGHFGFALLIIAAFPALRRFARRALSERVPESSRFEVFVVAIGKSALAFATAGALAAWFWILGGPERVERMVVNVDDELAKAFSTAGLARMFIAVVVAPFVEELVFRGFIYRAFERQWGWFVAMIVTSILFGLYHPYAWSAFISSVVLVCVMRRTGSIRAAIAVHMAYNLALWWPLLGQHIFPRERPLGDPATWYLQFAALALVLVAVPVYVWMSRDRQAVAPTLFLEPNGALSK